jgi:predicted metal-dependent peptidase
MAEHLTAEDYYVKVSDVQTGKHGSGTGDVGEWEEAPPQSSAEGIVDKSDADSLRDSIADDVAQHQAQWGNVPGGTLLWAQARAKGKLPRLDWRIKIRRRLREIVAGSSDFNAARLSRRQEPQERVLLSGKQSYIPKITVVVDTSGSMGAQGDWVAGCLRDINKMYKRTTLIDCDAAVHRIAKLKTWRDILKSLGGGGTDMRVGVAKAQELKADMIILLTDGETPWPSPWPANLVAVLPGGKVITNERVP